MLDQIRPHSLKPGRADLVARNVARRRLGFTTDLPAAVAGADTVFIAVGTPSRRGDGHADLSYVRAAALPAGRLVVVVTKSTVPVGTGDEIEAILRQARPEADVCVVSNPEFLREGAAIEDFKRPDRIVIGVEDPRDGAVMRELHRPLSLNQPPLIVVDRRASELTKYAANAFLAMKITFINEIADADPLRRRRLGRRQGRRHRVGPGAAAATAVRSGELVQIATLSTDATPAILSVEIARHAALAQEFEATHPGLGQVSPAVAGPWPPDGAAEAAALAKGIAAQGRPCDALFPCSPFSRGGMTAAAPRAAIAA